MCDRYAISNLTTFSIETTETSNTCYMRFLWCFFDSQYPPVGAASPSGSQCCHCFNGCQLLEYTQICSLVIWIFSAFGKVGCFFFPLSWLSLAEYICPNNSMVVDGLGNLWKIADECIKKRFCSVVLLSDVRSHSHPTLSVFACICLHAWV